MKEDLLKIINHYGVSNQLKKLSEEVFELQEAIINYEKDYNSMEVQDMTNDMEHITEEMADVFVVLRQFVEYYKINYEDFEKIREYKTERQLKRMEAEK